MKGWLILLLVILSCDTYALSVENTAHVYYSGSFIRVFTPLDGINIEEATLNSSSSFGLKVYDRLSMIKVDINDNTFNSNWMAVNVSNQTFVKLVKNTTELYKEFIDSLNATVIVGRNPLDEFIYDNYVIGIKYGFLKYKSIASFRPYNGAIISLTIDGERKIVIYGNAIDGEIASLRYLKTHIDEFKYFNNSAYIDGIDALSVYDFTHSGDNLKYYNTDTPEFYAIVDKALFGKCDEKLINVSADGVILREMELTPRNSEKMNNFRNNDTLPIVLARGLWSNLYTWKDYGTELADSGRKVYLIEITGGPGQDCTDCVNYDFSDLTNSYWPALIGTVQALNSYSQIQYVGHSNGARTGISSLEIYNEVGKPNAGYYLQNSTWINVSMTPHPVDTYIAIGLPGAFEGDSALSGIIEWRGDIIQEKIRNKELTHVTIENIELFGLTTLDYVSKNKSDMISVNLWNNYYFFIKNKNDTQPGKDVNIDNFMVIQGTGFLNNDGIVSTTDEEALYNNINSTNKYYFTYFSTHIGLPDRNDVIKVITELLNSKRINSSYLINYKNGTNK